MGISREIKTTGEFTVYAHSPEDYLTSHAAFDSDVEFSLNLYLSANYGVNLAGEMNTTYKGVRHAPEDLIYTYNEETGKYDKLDKEFLQSQSFLNTLEAGNRYFIPSLSENGQLDFTNPKILKVGQFKGENQLFIMADRQLRHAQAELEYIQEPTFWQRLADRIMKVFGSRNSACEDYDNLRTLMSDTLKNMSNDYKKVKSFELDRQGKEEQKNVVEAGEKTASKEMKEQLETVLLNTLFEGINSGNVAKEEQESLREEILGHIRETRGYNKMILLGDDNISRVLNDAQNRANMCTDVFNEVYEKMNQNEKVKTSDEPQQTNEKTIQQGESRPSLFK
jgi:hypothetical protein